MHSSRGWVPGGGKLGLLSHKINKQKIKAARLHEIV